MITGDQQEGEGLTAVMLGRRVRAAIQASGLPQQGVATAVGMDATALSKALAGKRNFSSLEFARICDTLRVSPLALLDDGKPPPDPVADAVAQIRHIVELDRLLTDLGLSARNDRWPCTLLDRALEAYIRGDISIRPIAGLVGADSDDLLDQLPPRS